MVCDFLLVGGGSVLEFEVDFVLRVSKFCYVKHGVVFKNNFVLLETFDSVFDCGF